MSAVLFATLTGGPAIGLVVAGAAALGHATPRRPTAPLPGARPRRAPLLSGRRRERILDAAFPDALDLFVVAVQAGHLPLEALVRIEAHVHPSIQLAIAEVARRVARGQQLIDALDAMVDVLGTRALTIVATVAMATRTGLAIAPMIDRIADDARHHRRRRAEAAARELPVRLAFPLVMCTLPSFVLIAIAPLLIGALSSLRGS